MLFLGAGASKPLGIPTMEEFTDIVIRDLSSLGDAYEPVVRKIQVDVRKWGLKPDIESVLTVLQGRANPQKALSDVGALVTLFSDEPQNPKEEQIPYSFVQTQIEEAIYKRCSKIEPKQAVQLYGELWDYIPNNLSIQLSPNSYQNIGPTTLLNVFTTNYDLSIETFLKRRRIAFNDGFRTDEVGDYVFGESWGEKTNLYKLHGSINYYQREDGNIIRSEAPLGDADAYGREIKGRMMIYPTGEKYAPRSPFYEYLGQLRHALVREPVCMVIGYSFRDVPINNAFLDGVQKNPNLRIMILGPSAAQIRDFLPQPLRKNTRAFNGYFGTNTMSPQAIAEQIKQWRL